MMSFLFVISFVGVGAKKKLSAPKSVTDSQMKKKSNLCYYTLLFFYISFMMKFFKLVIESAVHLAAGITT